MFLEANFYVVRIRKEIGILVNVVTFQDIKRNDNNKLTST